LRVRALILALLLLVIAAAATGCGRERPSDEPVAGEKEITEEEAFKPLGEEALTGRIRVDGSSTLAPYVSAAAKRFRRENPDVEIEVGVSGTGGGFERFCSGNTDLSNASRAIDEEEEETCQKARVRYFAVQVANDGLSVVVNRQNSWAQCLGLEQLKKIWEPDSEVASWKDVDARFPDVPLTLAGPGTASGTFDYFTGQVVGEEGSSRKDYKASEDDNVIVRTVEGSRGGLGYLGHSYVAETASQLRAVEIDGGDGCVAPTNETVQNGSYSPLSRPLYIYVNRDALDERLEVDSFLNYILDNQRAIAKQASFVPLTQQQLNDARTALGGASPE
jgi:phosphate transport system substrate-binding protein